MRAMEGITVDMSMLVGTIRRFGMSGPAYEIVGAGSPSPAGEPQMRIHVFDSGESLDYPVSAIVGDPAED